MRLTGKRAFLTGAGGAIGRATALKFAAEGATVIVSDIRAEPAEATAHAITESGGIAITAIGDLTDPQACEALFFSAAQTLGGIDIIFNNAGIVDAEDSGPIETPLAAWNKTIAANLTAVFLACKYALPHLLASKPRYPKSFSPTRPPGTPAAPTCRWAGSAAPRKSPTSSPSSPPTKPHTSPAPPTQSTAALRLHM